MELITGYTFTKINLALPSIPQLCKSIDLFNGGYLKEVVDISHFPLMTSIFIPNGVTSIGNIYDCASLKSIVLPTTLQKIGRIYNCSSLKSITFSGICDSCSFISCEGLTRLDLNGV
ncbi:leucine-rich repeat protein, partial [Methanobrevibacter sp.]